MNKQLEERFNSDKSTERRIMKDSTQLIMNDTVMINGAYIPMELLPDLIKWLQKVQKYNELKNKQKRKKVKNGSKSKWN